MKLSEKARELDEQRNLINELQSLANVLTGLAKHGYQFNYANTTIPPAMTGPIKVAAIAAVQERIDLIRAKLMLIGVEDFNG